MSTKVINVAVVDDDSSVRQALERLLRAAGLSPLIYSSAEDYLQDATRIRVDCLVLDIELGGMSGFNLQRRLAATGSVPPIIFITAYGEADTPEQARRAECAAYLRKPFTGRALLEAIRRAVAAAEPSSQ